MWLLVFICWHDRWPDDCIVPFFPVIIFSSRNWCVRILTRQMVIWDLFQPSVRRLYLFFRVVIFSGGSKNIAGQTTVPFFPVVIFLGHNWCSYFDTSTNYGTYIWPEKNSTQKKGTVVWPAMFFGRFKLQPEKITTWKKGTVVWPTVEIHVFWRVQITTGKK